MECSPYVMRVFWDPDYHVRCSGCNVLVNTGKEAPTPEEFEVIHKMHFKKPCPGPRPDRNWTFITPAPDGPHLKVVK